ncbi:MAG TPA: hypothetical protein VFZ53_12045 [Polyangiaceae bacterium]
MTEKFLDALDGRAAHDEVRGERMAKRMPADVPEAGVFQSALEWPPRLRMRQHGSVWLAEDVLAVPRTIAECVECLLAERDLARSTVLRRSDHSFRNGLANDQASGDEVDVDPTKADELAVAETRAERDDDHRAPLVLGAITR